MDSKIKRLTIFCMFFMIILVVLFVVYINRSELPQRNNGSQTVNSEIQLNENTRETFEGKQVGNNLKAFLEDEDFFDKEKTKYEKYLEQRRTVSMVLTSIEKDLRIKIVNYDGDIITGEEFVVSISGKGEYTDEDKNGIIYVPYLKAGDYTVTLQETEGYIVPANGAKVNVKNQVEYVAIDDISILIKTEDEIDPKLDDTSQMDAPEDTDKTEVKKLQLSLENAVAGIDVSKWNKEIDWEKVRKSGVEFAIIRCGYRGSSTGSLVIDPYFEQNIKGALDAGINVGVYFFTQAVTDVEAVEEASMVLSLIEKYHITYPVFIDTEGAGGNGRADNLDVDHRTLVCKAFCDTIESGGYNAGVYASKNWYNNRINVEELDEYYIWLAEYRKAPTYEGYFDMWQYTSKGQIDGISGNVDLNLSYIDIYAEKDGE